MHRLAAAARRSMDAVEARNARRGSTCGSTCGGFLPLLQGAQALRPLSRFGDRVACRSAGTFTDTSPKPARIGRPIHVQRRSLHLVVSIKVSLRPQILPSHGRDASSPALCACVLVQLASSRNVLGVRDSL